MAAPPRVPGGGKVPYRGKKGDQTVYLTREEKARLDAAAKAVNAAEGIRDAPFVSTTSKPKKAAPKPNPKKATPPKTVVIHPHEIVPSPDASPPYVAHPESNGSGSTTTPAAASPYVAPTDLSAQARRSITDVLAPIYAAFQTQAAQTATQHDGAAATNAAAYEALAKLQAAFGPQVQATYDQASATEATLGKGFSAAAQGQLDASAAEANRLLAQNNSPQQVQAANIADPLYGLGGALPASTLNREGAAFKTAADQMPQTTRGLGLEANRLVEMDRLQSLAAIRQSRSELDAKRPALYQQALGDLQAQASRDEALALNRQIAEREFGITTTGVDPATGNITLATRNKWAEMYGFDPLTNLPTLEQRRFVQTQEQYRKKLKKGGYTQKQIGELKGEAATIAQAAFRGLDAEHPALNYQDAFTEMVKSGVPLEIAQGALNRYYKRGDRGRPWLSYQQRQALKNAGLPEHPAAGTGRLSAKQQQALAAAGLPGIR